MSRQKYKLMSAKLDSLGIVTFIKRVERKRYEFIMNYEIKKVYKQRASCNKQIEKLFKKTYNKVSKLKYL